MLRPYSARIGRGYAELRRPDPRTALRIEEALGTAETVLNVGAGAGSYEPTDREVVAVEPSAVMRAQRRPQGAATCIPAPADDLPFDDQTFDVAMAITDAFFPAYWRRPDAYLEAEVRRATSVWSRVGEAAERRIVAALTSDLKSRRWHERNAELLDLDELDTGARLLQTADRTP